MEERVVNILLDIKADIGGLKKGQEELKQGQKRIEGRMDVLEADVSELKIDMSEVKTTMCACRQWLSSQVIINSRLGVSPVVHYRRYNMV